MLRYGEAAIPTLTLPRTYMDHFNIITLYLLKTYETYSAKIEKTKEKLVWYGYNKAAALLELARKPFAIGSKSQLSVLWKRCLNFRQFDSNLHFLLCIGIT